MEGKVEFLGQICLLVWIIRDYWRSSKTELVHHSQIRLEYKDSSVKASLVSPSRWMSGSLKLWLGLILA